MDEQHIAPQEIRFIDMGAAYLAARIRDSFPGAVITQDDCAVYPPAPDSMDGAPVIARKMIVELGQHKITLQVAEELEYARRRERYREFMPHRNISAGTTAFEGPTIPGGKLDFYGGLHYTPDFAQGVGCSFSVCSYDAAQDAMIQPCVLNPIHWTFDNKFHDYLQQVADYAGTPPSRPGAVHVRSQEKYFKKVFG